MALSKKNSWHVVVGCLGLLFFFTCSSCNMKKLSGEGYKNYPDMRVIVRDYLQPFKTFPKSFTLVTTTGTSKDTQLIPAAKVDWAYWESVLLKTNIYSKAYDHKYKIEAINDDMLATVNYFYTPSDMTCKTKKINAIIDAFDEQVKSLYIEYENPGFISSESYKVLFVYGKSLQIQERSKRPFQKTKERVQLLIF
jgi:hypothetical protein